MGILHWESKSSNSVLHILKHYHDATSKGGGRGYSGTEETLKGKLTNSDEE